MSGDRRSADRGEVTYTARWILPIDTPPIRHGYVRVRHNQVTQLGQGRPSGKAIDLGDAAILPGLVNAHTHLEFSDLDRPIDLGDTDRSGVALHDWITRVVATRGRTTPTQRSQAMLRGWNESVAAGTSLLCDIATLPVAEDVLAAMAADGDALQAILLGEVIGLSASRCEERLRSAEEFARRETDTSIQVGFSPHAPYSTRPRAIEAVIAAAHPGGRLVAMHVAESVPERELLLHGRGEFVSALSNLGVWASDCFPWGDLPADPDAVYVPLITRLAAAKRALLIHGNDLRPPEIDCLSRHRNVTVVHCPRTHAFFGHPPAPLTRWIGAGIRVAIGTDSRASNPDLNVWREVQHLLNHRQDVDPSVVLRMATVDAAAALGRSVTEGGAGPPGGGVGSIRVGSRCGLGSVATGANDLDALMADLATHGYRPLPAAAASAVSG